jgi:hypothetical protein
MSRPWDLRINVWSTSQGGILLFRSTSALLTLAHLKIKRYEA